MDWTSAFRQLADDRHTSMRELAVQLGISQQFLSDVVRGAKPPSPWLKFRYYGLAGWKGSIEQITSLLPDDLAEAVRAADQKGLEKLAEAARKKAEKNDKKL